MPTTIELNQPYHSIRTLESPELPDFTVLIGRNGAGKTQLLEALAEGHAAASGTPQHEIERYDIVSFCAANNNRGNRGSNQFARTTASAYLRGDRGPAPIAVAAEIFEEFCPAEEEEGSEKLHDEFVRDLRDRINRTPDFHVFPGERTKDRGTYGQALLERVMGPLRRKVPKQNRKQKGERNSFNGDPAALVSTAMKRAGKLPHELTDDDIIRAAHFEGGTISNAISEVFAAYKVDQYVWAHERIETETVVPFTDLIAQYEHQRPPPWDTLRNVMAMMRDAAGEDGLFDFEFSDPADIRIDMSNYERFTFKTEMTNRTTGTRYELDALSSGEKILMALCLASFNQQLGRRRPKLLLLDELDAMLHPSMVAALVEALKSLFVEHGTKVLMTSHSPMTVAALRETEVFRMVRNAGHVRIMPTTKGEAIEELSEGIATVDTGLRIAAHNNAEVTILSEGHNARHLKRWVELNFEEGVHVFDELPRHTSDSQLLAYGRLLACMDPASHFVVVWDCDAAGTAQELRNELRNGAKVTPFAFKRRSDNKIARRGIENNYDDEVLAPYVINKTDSTGRLLGREFNASLKTEFANHVREHGTPDYFSHFKDLHTVVSGVLASRSSLA